MKQDPFEWLSEQAEPRTLAAAGVALLLIALLAGFLYGLKPAWTVHVKLAQQHEDVRFDAVTHSVSTTALVGQMRSEIEDLRGQLYGDAAGIPKTEIESFVVDALDRLAARHQVELRAITPGAAGAIWMFDELPYEVRVEGPYFALHRWLYEVEDALRPMIVKRFDLSPNRQRDGVILDLRVVAYRAADGEGA